MTLSQVPKPTLIMPRETLDLGHASEIALAVLGYNPMADEYTPGQWTGRLALRPARAQPGQGWQIGFNLTRRLAEGEPQQQTYRLRVGGPGSLQLFQITGAVEQPVERLYNRSYVSGWLVKWGYWAA